MDLWLHAGYFHLAFVNFSDFLRLLIAHNCLFSYLKIMFIILEMETTFLYTIYNKIWLDNISLPILLSKVGNWLNLSYKIFCLCSQLTLPISHYFHSQSILRIKQNRNFSYLLSFIVYSIQYSMENIPFSILTWKPYLSNDSKIF